MKIEKNIPKAGKKKVSEFKHFFVLLLFIICQSKVCVFADTSYYWEMTVGNPCRIYWHDPFIDSCYISDTQNFKLEIETPGNNASKVYYLKALTRGHFNLKITIYYGAKYPDIYDLTINVYDVTDIIIPDDVKIHVGESYTYNPTVTDTKATTTLSWQNSDPSVVSMNNGTITGLKVGTSTITCISHNGVKAQSHVTVDPVAANNIELNYSDFELELYKKVKLQAKISPDNAANKNVTWNSSNPNVAMVGSDGTVTGISEGFAMITATTTDGSNLYATCLIHVFTPKILVSSIIFDNEKISLFKGESSTINATIIPSNANNPVLNWMSSDPNIVTVDGNGNIYAISEGIATITASSTDGSNISKSCEITVSKKELPDNKKRGDVNGDGELTVEDITTLIQMMIE